MPQRSLALVGEGTVLARIFFSLAAHVCGIGRTRRAMKLNGKVAIVTGGRAASDCAIAKRLCGGRRQGRHRRMSMRRPARRLRARSARPAASWPPMSAMRSRPQSLVADACAAFGALDILVNNAGIVHAADFLDLAEADFDRVLRVNLKGAFLVGQAAARRMVDAGQGRQAGGHDHQHELGQRRAGDPQPGALLRVEGRHRRSSPR